MSNSTDPVELNTVADPDGGTQPSVTPGRPTIDSVQKHVLENLKLKRGILNGRDLYRQYGESNIAVVKAAIQALQKENLISVKGNLENTLGVFQSVVVKR